MLKLLYDGSSRNKGAKAKVISIGGPVHSLLRVAFDSDSENFVERFLVLAKGFVEELVAEHIVRAHAAG